jgi:TolB-like protein
MSDDAIHSIDAIPSPSDVSLTPHDKSAKKRKKKVRSVWISFVGRIVAQFVGSAATIVLGLLLLQKYQPSGKATTTSHGVSTQTQVADSATRLTTFTSHPVDDFALAVLPLSTYTADASREFVADAMTDVLTAEVAKLPGLRVVSRTSAIHVRKEHSVADISSALGVRYVIEGSVAQADGHMRISVQLIDALRDQHMWSGRYDRPTRDLLNAQEQIATTIAREVRAVILDQDGEGLLPTSGRLNLSDRLASPTPEALHAAQATPRPRVGS